MTWAVRSVGFSSRFLSIYINYIAIPLRTCSVPSLHTLRQTRRCRSRRGNSVNNLLQPQCEIFNYIPFTTADYSIIFDFSISVLCPVGPSHVSVLVYSSITCTWYRWCARWAPHQFRYFPVRWAHVTNSQWISCAWFNTPRFLTRCWRNWLFHFVCYHPFGKHPYGWCRDGTNLGSTQIFFPRSITREAGYRAKRPSTSANSKAPEPELPSQPRMFSAPMSPSGSYHRYYHNQNQPSSHISSPRLPPSPGTNTALSLAAFRYPLPVPPDEEAPTPDYASEDPEVKSIDHGSETQDAANQDMALSDSSHAHHRIATAKSSPPRPRPPQSHLENLSLYSDLHPYVGVHVTPYPHVCDSRYHF